jgi:hypothetical protein
MWGTPQLQMPVLCSRAQSQAQPESGVLEAWHIDDMNCIYLGIMSAN